MAGHQDYEELAAGHALNALEPGDEQLFLTHLADCAECQRLLADFSEVAAGLAISSADEPEVAPPPQVWQHIRAAVGDEPVVTSLHARRRRLLSREMVMGAAAALVLITVGVAGWKVATSSSSSPSVQSAVSDCKHSSDCHVVQLTGSNSVSPYLLLRGQEVRIATSSLPALDAANRTYVLWQLPQAGRPVGVVAFEVPPGNHATVAQATR